MSVATTGTPHEHGNALDAALTYASHGLRVIPIAPGLKHPPMRSWEKVATTDLAIIRSWWTGLYRGHGVGIATGEESGVWVLDVDVAGGKVGNASLAELEACYEPLPETVESITGTGGRHLFFTWDPAHPIHNNQSGKAGKDLDIRGEGGQVLAAPTIHPDTHVPYRFRPGHAFGECPVAPAPGWLYAILDREPDPPVRPAPSRSLLGVTDDEDSPAAMFNASTTWEQLLTRDGWTLARHLGSGEQRWTRPGKSPRDGVSATVGHAGRDVLKVFTSSVPELAADGAYSRFGYEAAVRYHGDRSALASELRRAMNGVPRAELTNMSWLTDIVAALAMADADTTTEAQADEWPEPEPLEPAITHGAPFPVDVLPPWIARQVLTVADSFQVPVDLPAMFALGALSTVVMGHLKVRVTGTDWTEYTNLYLTAALPPGAGKTPAFKAMTRCVGDLETDLIADAQQTIREATIVRAVLEKRAKQAFESAALKSGSVDEAVRAQAEFDALEIPAPPRLLADDATPESLAVVMSEHGGRMGLLSDEGDVFDIMAGQYAQAGKSTNLSPYLKGHSAGAIKQDRIGRARVHIPEALLTVCVATQPRVLAKLGENPELAGRGLSSRFMYCVPASNVGFRDRYAVLRDRDVDAQKTYDDTVKELGRYHRRFTYPVTLDLTLEARDRFLEWDQALEDQLRPGGDLATVAEWAMKLRSSVLRLAGLLHVADGAQGDISVGVLERALVVAGYWTDHACRVHATWGTAADVALRRARQIVAWATAAGEERASFTVREAYVECRNHDGSLKVEAVHEAIKRLVEMGWARTGSDFPGGKGRKSPTVLLHPEARDVLAHNAHIGETASHDPGCARCARSALMERYAFSSSLSTGKSESEKTSLLSRFAHNAHIEEGPSAASPPPGVTDPDQQPIYADVDLEDDDAVPEDEWNAGWLDRKAAEAFGWEPPPGGVPYVRAPDLEASPPDDDLDDDGRLW